MLQLKYLKIIKMTKKALEEYKNWGEYEVTVDRLKVKKTSVSGQNKNFSKGSNAAQKLEVLKKEVLFCQKCVLGKSRLNAVFGSGCTTADLMFVGEGPGFEEDHKGEPFIGKAGQLLTKIIESIGQSRETVYIANIVKCHPMKDPSSPEERGNDRPPFPEEMEICRLYLDKQIEIIAPKIIVTLGSSATKGLLKSEEPISKMRGTFKSYNGVKLMPTYHPAALLRNPSLKKDVWSDMKKVIHYLDDSRNKIS
ncbi:MAG: uracil-DNA glycosylase [Elusimicrobiota bacterium]|jgi:DNA polymerase|nr:uracil-DNA glycosylase [Elusimicrobiota bacterium]